MPNLQQEYQARIVAVSMGLSRFYQQAMNEVIAHSEAGKPQEDLAILLEKISMDWAKTIVDDIAPEQHIIQER